MKKRFRIIINFEAIIHEKKNDFKNLGVKENKDVNKLALQIATDKQKLMDWMGFNITELLGDDFYTEKLYEKLGISNEYEIISSAIKEMELKKSNSLIQLFKKPVKETGNIHEQAELENVNFSQASRKDLEALKKKVELKVLVRKKDKAMNLLAGYFENPKIVDAAFEEVAGE